MAMRWAAPCTERAGTQGTRENHGVHTCSTRASCRRASQEITRFYTHINLQRSRDTRATAATRTVWALVLLHRMPSLPRTRIARHRHAPCHAHPPIVHAATACMLRSRQRPTTPCYALSLWQRMVIAARQRRLRRPRSSLPAHSVRPVKPRWPSKLFDSTPAGGTTRTFRSR